MCVGFSTNIEHTESNIPSVNELKCLCLIIDCRLRVSTAIIALGRLRYKLKLTDDDAQYQML